MSRFSRSASTGFLASISGRAGDRTGWVAGAYLRRCAAIAAFLGLLPCGVATAGWLPGPFVPGSGSYTLVPGGDFESGSSEWILEGSYYGSWAISLDYALSGSHAAKGTAGRSSNYYGFAWDNRDVPVAGGQTYVVSAFFYRLQAEDYWLYVDLDDVSWDIHNQSRSTHGDEWQFRWSEVTVPPDVSFVTVRLVMDSNLDPGDIGYVDDVAITPIAEFVPPESLVPGPTILVREPWVKPDDVHSGASGVDSLRLAWSEAVTFTASDITISDEVGSPVAFTVTGSESALMTITFDAVLLNNKYTITIHDSVRSANDGAPIDGDNDGHTGGDAVLVMEHRNPFDRDRDNDVDQEDFAAFQRCSSGPGIPADPNCE